MGAVGSPNIAQLVTGGCHPRAILTHRPRLFPGTPRAQASLLVLLNLVSVGALAFHIKVNVGNMAWLIPRVGTRGWGEAEVSLGGALQAPG